jgi:DNA-binding NarL/FixJ family response regulator
MNVIIADDHVIFRNGLKLALETSCEDIRISEAGDYEGLLRLLNRGDPPDVLILDLNMPDLVRNSGIMTLRGRIAPAPILILSASEDAEDVFQCLGAGAAGYVPKSADIATVVLAMQTVRSGGIYVPRELMVGAVPLTNSKDASQARVNFTQRQTVVLRLASEGHANKEIAFRLGISEGTVKTHLAAVMRSLAVHNRVQLLREAERLGYVPRR